jgi:hypothetical protein
MGEVGKALAWGVERVAPAVASGKCVLFLGAGIHCGPPGELVADGTVPDYPEAARPLLAGALSEQISDRLRLRDTHPDEDPRDLLRTSQFFEGSEGRRELVDLIEAAVQTSRSPSPLLQMLAAMPFRVILTTNYDTLFERALRDNGKDPEIAVYQKDGSHPHQWDDDPTEHHPHVIKLHGDIDKDRNSIVVTDEDYIHFLLRMNEPRERNPVPDGVKQYMARSKWRTLFLGYSLKDPNLKLLFRSIRRGVDVASFPQAYSIDFRPDPLILDTWQSKQFVWFVEEEIWHFVPALAEAVRREQASSQDRSSG